MLYRSLSLVALALLALGPVAGAEETGADSVAPASLQAPQAAHIQKVTAEGVVIQLQFSAAPSPLGWIGQAPEEPANGATPQTSRPVLVRWDQILPTPEPAAPLEVAKKAANTSFSVLFPNCCNGAATTCAACGGTGKCSQTACQQECGEPAAKVQEGKLVRLPETTAAGAPELATAPEPAEPASPLAAALQALTLSNFSNRGAAFPLGGSCGAGACRCEASQNGAPVCSCQTCDCQSCGGGARSVLEIAVREPAEAAATPTPAGRCEAAMTWTANLRKGSTCKCGASCTCDQDSTGCKCGADCACGKEATRLCGAICACGQRSEAANARIEDLTRENAELLTRARFASMKEEYLQEIVELRVENARLIARQEAQEQRDEYFGQLLEIAEAKAKLEAQLESVREVETLRAKLTTLESEVRELTAQGRSNPLR